MLSINRVLARKPARPCGPALRERGCLLMAIRPENGGAALLNAPL
jgi:hypothetical protein